MIIINLIILISIIKIQLELIKKFDQNFKFLLSESFSKKIIFAKMVKKRVFINKSFRIA
jgi:hypothetical protein